MHFMSHVFHILLERYSFFVRELRTTLESSSLKYASDKVRCICWICFDEIYESVSFSSSQSTKYCLKCRIGKSRVSRIHTQDTQIHLGWSIKSCAIKRLDSPKDRCLSIKIIKFGIYLISYCFIITSLYIHILGMPLSGGERVSWYEDDMWWFFSLCMKGSREMNIIFV